MTLLQHMRCSGLAALLLGLGVVIGSRADGTVPIFEALTAELDAYTRDCATAPYGGAAAHDISLREAYVSPRWEDVVLSVPTRPPAA